MGRTWFEDCFRKFFFDLHTPEQVENVASEFDADDWARQLEEARVQAVSAFAKCAYGWSYYRKCKVGFVHPRLPEGRDLLGETVEACHRRGIRVIAYYHAFGSEPLSRERPEWMARKGDGSSDGFCLLGPLLEEHMIPQIVEIADGYEIDGLFMDGMRATGACYCQSCRERFQAEFGAPIPEGKDDRLWAAYVEWRMSEFRKGRARIVSEAHATRPELLVAFNWICSPKQPEMPPQDMGFLTADILPEDQLFTGSCYACYWDSLAFPFDIMNTLFLRWWGDWAVKPTVRLKQECATILANGGRTFPGYQMYPNGIMEPAVMERVAELFRFVEEREEVLKGTLPVRFVGVFHSLRSHLMRGADVSADETAMSGAHRVLLNARIPHTFVNEETLEDHMADYAALILPDQRSVPERLVPAFEEFVSRGGVLIATHLTGTLDESGKERGEFALSDMLGVSFVDLIEHSHAYVSAQDERLKGGYSDMPVLTRAQFVRVNPQQCQTLATITLPLVRSDDNYLWTREYAASPPAEKTEMPAITLREFGKGKAVYISPPAFLALARDDQWPLKAMMANLITALLPPQPVIVEGEGDIEVVLREGNGLTAVHLVNHGGSRSFGRNNAITESVPRAREVQVRLLANGEPRAVRQVPPGSPLSFHRSGPYLVTEPFEFEIHTGIIIQWQERT